MTNKEYFTREEFVNMIEAYNKAEKERQELQAENDRLRNELATYGATGVCEVCSDKANKLADKYLGCLQEIKAISEKIIKNVSEDCINITPMFLVHKEILQKINKAEEE